MRNLQDLTDEELAMLYVEGSNPAFMSCCHAMR